jgi:5-methylcytosine-specific restriction protein A
VAKHSTWKPYPLPRDWQKRRAEVLERDGHRCTFLLSDGARCTEPATTVDHIVNIRNGGTHDLSNLRAACSFCHRRKTSREGQAAQRGTRRTQQHPREEHPGILHDDE